MTQKATQLIARLFDLPENVLPAIGGAIFPIRRVYCVGRNYSAHSLEMGNNTPSKPFFFQKAADCVVPVAPEATGRIPYPSNTNDYQHEVELVVAIGTDGKEIEVAKALSHVYGYAVGLDMTRRDLQKSCSAVGHPWEVGKSADKSAPIGFIHPVKLFGHPKETATIRLELNGTQKQFATINQMTWGVPDLISYLSQFFTLHQGDLIFTGTPAGVGAVYPGDKIRAQVEGLADLNVIVDK